MSHSAFALILLSALIHTTWNVLAKRYDHAPKAMLIAVSELGAALILLPLALLTTDVSGISNVGWLCLVGTGIGTAIYTLLLARAYESGAMTTVYPIARGTGILGTAMLAPVVGLDAPSGRGILGLMVLASGVLVAGLGPWLRDRRHKDVPRGLGWAFLVGLTITVYSLIDKTGVSLGLGAVSPLFYVMFQNLAAGVILLPMILSSRHRSELKTVLGRDLGMTAMVGFGSLGAYFLVLNVLQTSPASYVVALREISIGLAAVAGVVLLREPVDRLRWVGIGLILAGAILIKSA